MSNSNEKLSGKKYVHELIPPGGLPHVGRQWFAPDAVPDQHKGYIGEVRVLAADMTIWRGMRQPNGVIEVAEPNFLDRKVKFWCLPPDSTV